MIVQRAARMLPVDSIYLLYSNLFLAALWGAVAWVVRVVGGRIDGVGKSKAGYGFLGGAVSVGQLVRGVAKIIAIKSFFGLGNQKKMYICI